mgnify:CR=1 FL=1
MKSSTQFKQDHSSASSPYFSDDVRDFSQVEKSIPCQEACPAKTNVPGYIRDIYEEKYGRAYEINRACNILPGVLGRICSRPCEEACRHGNDNNGDSVAICYLKRSCADLKSPMHRIIEGLYTPTGKKVAVIGSGPAGLAVAHELAVMGHKVTIYESEEKPGGMLMYGIPEFRLPRNLLLSEIENILRLGIDLHTSTMIGKDINLEDLHDIYDAIVAAIGCMKPRTLEVAGEGLENVYNGLDFMKMVNAGQTPYVGEKTVVIGAGFTAVDCARSAVRLGASQVDIHMRKTVELMRIDAHEKVEAQYEHIGLHGLMQPNRIIGENGRVTGIEFLRTRLEQTDRSPYRVSVPIENSEFVIPADTIIAALGQTPDKEVIFNRAQQSLTMEGYFSAGDFVSGSSDVIHAIADGKRCAQEVDHYLTGMVRKKKMVRIEPCSTTDRDRSFDFISRTAMDTIGLSERKAQLTAEVESGFNTEQAYEESKRCYLCNLRYEIDPQRCIYCSACIDVMPKDCIKMVKGIVFEDSGAYQSYETSQYWNQATAISIDNSKCIRCGKCLEVCPMDCISVHKTELVEVDLASESFE